jgi:heterodisulfide reductase subunit C
MMHVDRETKRCTHCGICRTGTCQLNPGFGTALIQEVEKQREGQLTCFRCRGRCAEAVPISSDTCLRIHNSLFCLSP